MTSDAGKLALDCVRFLVAQVSARTPIKRADIFKFITTRSTDLSTAIKNTVFTEAGKMLEEVYGYRMVPISNRAQPQFILVLGEDEIRHKSSGRNNAILMATLSHIFMSDGSVKEEDMWKFLDKAGLIKIDDLTSRKILTKQFTRELYVTYNKVTEFEQVKFVFAWGERAKHELSQKYLLGKIASTFGKPPDQWRELDKEATDNDLKYFTPA